MGSVLGFALLFCCRFVLKKKTKKKPTNFFYCYTSAVWNSSALVSVFHRPEIAENLSVSVRFQKLTALLLIISPFTAIYPPETALPV